MRRAIRGLLFGSVVALACACAGANAQSGNDLNVYFGYADSGSAAGRQLPPQFPNPWQGSGNVHFVGSGTQFDAGTIRLHNPTGNTVTLQSVTVDIDQNHYDLWTGTALTVPANGDLILTQTRVVQPKPIATDFDTSEAAGQTCTPSTRGGQPVVHLTLNGSTTNLTDRDRILNTGGRDYGQCAGKPNESHQWDLVGSLAVPGGQTSNSAVGDPWLLGLTGGLIALFSFLPALLGALLLLLVGWWLARWLGGLVAGILDRIGLGPAINRVGLLDFLGRRDPRHTNAAWLLGALLTWFVFLFFLLMAAQALHIAALTQFLTAVALWLPKLISAILVIFVAAILARVIGRIVRGAAADGGFANAELLANVARIAILGFGVILALDQAGIARPFMELLFGALAFTLALAFGLAFGLGGRDTAAQMLQRWYGDRRSAPRRAKT